MVTRSKSDEPAAGVRKKTTTKRKTAAAPAPAKKAAAASKQPVAAAAPAAAETDNRAEALLRAGLKALDNVRNDVVKRQTHVIESLLGARAVEELKARAFPGLDRLVGFRKFEDVFDQRVATALQRLGMPSAQEIEALREEVRELRKQLAARGQGTRTTTKR